VAITRGRTADNMANLSDTYKRQVIDPLLGTRLGQQELDGVLLEDVEGALFIAEQIETDRIRFGEVPALAETVVAVDPSTTGGEASDEAGIVAVGRGTDGHAYALADLTVRGSPLVWAVAAWRAAFDSEAEALIVEDNQGGEMCEVTLLAAWPQVSAVYAQAGRIRPAVRRIHAVSSKRARAVPVALMYERHQVHHVLDVGSGANSLLLLEGELTGWDGTGDSPNRLDALVHGVRWLYRIGVKSERVVVPGRWSGGRN
jgi:phage terminase large subunit-like protein